MCAWSFEAYNTILQSCFLLDPILFQGQGFRLVMLFQGSCMSYSCGSMLGSLKRSGLLASSPGPFLFLSLLEKTVQNLPVFLPVFLAYSRLQLSYQIQNAFVDWIAVFSSFVALSDYYHCSGMQRWIALFQVSVEITSIEELVSTLLWYVGVINIIPRQCNMKRRRIDL